MLDKIIGHFIRSCQLAQLSNRSIQTLQIRLKEFERFLRQKSVRSIKKVTHFHLVDFISDFQSPSIHVRKARIWTMHQFFKFLTLHEYVPKDISFGLKYPKIERRVPDFLTRDESVGLIHHFCKKAQTVWGLRDLVIVLLLAVLGLRTSTLLGLNVEHVDVHAGLLAIKEKGQRQRQIILPRALCRVLERYLRLLDMHRGPLLITNRRARFGPRMLQILFQNAAKACRIEKDLNARMLRHSAATELNRKAGTQVTQFVLGHSHRGNTLLYAHLNPDKYAVYMKRHPFMKKEAACLQSSTGTEKRF